MDYFLKSSFLRGLFLSTFVDHFINWTKIQKSPKIAAKDKKFLNCLPILDILKEGGAAQLLPGENTPCAENDKIDVLAIGASQFRGNYLPLLQKLLHAHKVVLNSPSPFNKNTHPHPLIFLRGSTHQKSESVNTQRREVI